MLEFGRLITAMVTPFKDDHSIDFDAYGRLVEGLIDAGNDALLSTGTTGESPVLTESERADLYREAVRAAGGRARIIAGTGGYSTEESKHLSRLAADCDIHALLQVAPYYNRPPQDGLYEHFKAIAEATPLPNILYNVPGRTVTNIDADTVARLSQIDNIIGIKEASADLDQIAEIIRTAHPDFLIYSGNDADTLPMMVLGGVGVISVASHVISGEIRQMIDAFVEGDMETARKKHLDNLPLFRALFPAGWSNPIAVKAALNLGGFPAGPPRLPLVEFPPEMIDNLAAIMHPYKLDSFLSAPAAVN